jgi:hypothetical protein
LPQYFKPSTEEYQKYIISPPDLIYDTYEELTTKVYLTFKHIYQQHNVKFDWYLKADDDT